MPPPSRTIYTVEIDGTQYDIEGDRPPTEQEARAAVGNFSGNGGTKNSPSPSSMKDVVNAEMAQEHTTQPGQAGDFVDGLIGGSGVVGPTIGELWKQGPSALSPLASGENLGGLVRDVGMLGIGAKAGGILQGTGRAAQAVGKAASGGPGNLAMRAIAGHTVGGPAGAVAAAAGPPILKGFGRVLERTGNALDASPAAAQATIQARGSMRQEVLPGRPDAVTPRQAPAPGPVVEGEVLSQQALPQQVPRAELGPATSTQHGPGSGPGQGMGLPDIGQMKQQEMLRALEGPAPLGSSAADVSSGGAPLGSLPASSTPRVKSWKPGFGPSAGDAATMREAYGSKTAAQLMKTRQDQIGALAPREGNAPVTLPSQVQQQITQDFAQVPLEGRADYIARAGTNPLVRQLLESLAQK